MRTQTNSIIFDQKVFCFTGQLADLKRLEAEREVRIRGGLTTNTVNKHLDYLVIGSIPSAGWSNGNYGTKISKVRKLTKESKDKPFLISESVFLTALGEFPSTNSGVLDAKIVVCNYNFTIESKKNF